MLYPLFCHLYNFDITIIKIFISILLLFSYEISTKCRIKIHVFVNKIINNYNIKIIQVAKLSLEHVWQYANIIYMLYIMLRSRWGLLYIVYGMVAMETTFSRQIW